MYLKFQVNLAEVHIILAGDNTLNLRMTGKPPRAAPLCSGPKSFSRWVPLLGGFTVYALWIFLYRLLATMAINIK